MKGLKDIQNEILPRFMKGIFFMACLSLAAFIIDNWGSPFMGPIYVIYIPLVFVLGSATLIPGLPGGVRVMVLKVLLFIFATTELFLFGYDSYAFFLFFSASLIGITMINRVHGWITEFLSIVVTIVIAAFHTMGLIDPYDFGLDFQLYNEWLPPILLYTTFSVTLLYVVDQITMRLGRQLDWAERLRLVIQKEKEKLAAVNRELEDMAYKDPITGLPNLRAAEKVLAEYRDLPENKEL